jgi:hypothetical protein
MQRQNVGVYLLVFLGLLCVQASAQEIPEQARKDLAENLHGSFMVFRDPVQQDLKLTGEQKVKLEEHLRELIPDAMTFFQGMEGLKQEEREKQLKGFRKKAQEKLTAFLKETLKDDQRKRVHQLELQREGAFTLLHGEAELGKELKITTEQRQQFMTIIKDMQKKIEPLIKEAHSGGDPHEIRPKAMKIRKEHENKIVALLTDTQKKLWTEKLGKPLALDD